MPLVCTAARTARNCHAGGKHLQNLIKGFRIAAEAAMMDKWRAMDLEHIG